MNFSTTYKFTFMYLTVNCVHTGVIGDHCLYYHDDKFDANDDWTISMILNVDFLILDHPSLL